MSESSKIAPRPMLYAFSVSHFLHDLYTGVWLLVLAAQVVALDLSYTQAGIAQAGYTLTTALTQPFFGAYFDRSGKPYLALWSVTFTTVMVTLVGLASGYWLVVLGSVGAGLGSSAFHAAGLSGAKQLAVGRGEGSATAIFLVGGNGGYAFGAFIGGLILDRYGASMLTLPALLIVFANPFILRVLKPYLQGLSNRSARTTRQIIAGGRKAWLPLAVYAVVVLSYQAYFGGFTVYLPQYLESQSGDLNYAGRITSIFLLFAAIGSLVGGTLSDYVSRRLIAVTSLILIAPLSFAVLRLDGNILVIVAVLLGLCTNIALPILLLIGQEVFPGGRSTAGGFAFGATFLARAVTTPVLGGIADTFGLQEALTLSGVLPLLVVILFFWLPADA